MVYKGERLQLDAELLAGNIPEEPVETFFVEKRSFVEGTPEIPTIPLPMSPGLAEAIDQGHFPS